MTDRAWLRYSPAECGKSPPVTSFHLSLQDALAFSFWGSPTGWISLVFSLLVIEQGALVSYPGFAEWQDVWWLLCLTLQMLQHSATSFPTCHWQPVDLRCSPIKPKPHASSMAALQGREESLIHYLSLWSYELIVTLNPQGQYRGHSLCCRESSGSPGLWCSQRTSFWRLWQWTGGVRGDNEIKQVNKWTS